jgi:NhaA family Na+:H+ antiporter
MAIATNAAGLVVVGLTYQPVSVRPGGTALMVAALALAFLFRRLTIRHFWPYLAVCGPLSWLALYLDGLHPALALVPIVPFLPHKPRTVTGFDDSSAEPPSSPRYFEHEWNYVVQAALFLFALVNAGVLLQRHGTGTWALVAAAVVGRPLGILAATAAAVALGARLPAPLHWRELTVVALASSSGFTFALFAATAVYPAGPILAELKLGAVLTGIGVVLAFAAAHSLKIGRFAMSHTARTLLVLLAVVLTCGGLVSAQAPASMSDDEIQALVKERLLDRQITSVDISVSKQVVTLRGVVPSLWAKQKALERTRETRGVQQVINALAIVRAESDARIGEQVTEDIARYAFFTMFDDAEVEVTDGIVTLMGKVTLGYKADALVDLASRVRGVQDVHNLITTLPVSTFDDQLRYTIARNIYDDALFWGLAIQPYPPIHIIVDGGRVTLTGVVDSEVERRMAESIARSTFGVFNVQNKLRVAED